VRDSAADAGTLAHALIEAHTMKLPSVDESSYTDEQRKLAHQGLDSFKEWAKSVKLKIIAAEVPMISETFRVGGTLDAVAKIGDDLAILDYKSGKVWYDAIIQTAIYRELWNETHPDQRVGPRVHILRVGKEDADFVHRSYDNLTAAVECFVAMQRVYELGHALAKRI
jgi:hypothetical protein